MGPASPEQREDRAPGIGCPELVDRGAGVHGHGFCLASSHHSHRRPSPSVSGAQCQPLGTDRASLFSVQQLQPTHGLGGVLQSGPPPAPPSLLRVARRGSFRQSRAVSMPTPCDHLVGGGEETVHRLHLGAGGWVGEC